MKSTKIVEVLNRIHKLDPTVLPALIETRVPCNEELADDPAVQVLATNGDGIFEIGILGILNGLVENGEGYVFAIFDTEGNLTHFMQSK